jgi:hypothetical protein
LKFSVKGVFPALVNKKAFIDRVVLSIWGLKRSKPCQAVRNLVNRPIGGIGKKYARKDSGVLAASGNSFDLMYGRLQLKQILPPLVVTIRSDEGPTTATIVGDAIDALCEAGWRASISQVELTFDLGGIAITEFRRTVFSSAHRFRSLRDKTGRRTFYIGGRTSPWQARIYQKTEGMVRLEFVLRRPFLRRHGITQIADLEKLRSVDLSRRVWLREVNRAGLKLLERKVQETENDDVRQRIPRRWIKDLPLREAVPAVKKYFGAVPDQLLRVSPLETRIRRMQQKLVV